MRDHGAQDFDRGARRGARFRAPLVCHSWSCATIDRQACEARGEARGNPPATGESAFIGQKPQGRVAERQTLGT